MTTTGAMFHITEPEAWESARAAGEYTQSTRGRSLADVGYIHCSFPSQIAMVASAVYDDRTEPLLLLEIDPARVPSQIVVENLDGGAQAFPHIYGALPLDAVTTVHRLARSADGWLPHIRGLELGGFMLRGAELSNITIEGELENVTVNGVEVWPLVVAELDRRDPLRPKMRPTDLVGFREAWAILEPLWGDTVVRARQLDPSLLHESVNGEWSFIETLRHLTFATDSWIRRAVLGDPSPWDALGLPWDEMPDTVGVPRDRNARPSLDAVLEIRRDRMQTVRSLLDGLTDESLDAHTEPVEGPGWPPPRSFPVRECLLIILNEEWEHRRFAERDLEVLAARNQ